MRRRRSPRRRRNGGSGPYKGGARARNGRSFSHLLVTASFPISSPPPSLTFPRPPSSPPPSPTSASPLSPPSAPCGAEAARPRRGRRLATQPLDWAATAGRWPRRDEMVAGLRWLAPKELALFGGGSGRRSSHPPERGGRPGGAPPPARRSTHSPVLMDGGESEEKDLIGST